MSQPNQTNTVPFENGGADVVALYQSGLSIPAVGKQLGVHSARVSRLLRKLNVPRRSCHDQMYLDKKTSGRPTFNYVEGPITNIISLEAIAALYRGRTYDDPPMTAQEREADMIGNYHVALEAMRRK